MNKEDTLNVQIMVVSVENTLLNIKLAMKEAIKQKNSEVLVFICVCYTGFVERADKLINIMLESDNFIDKPVMILENLLKILKSTRVTFEKINNTPRHEFQFTEEFFSIGL